MWTKDHKKSDANHIACINLIQRNTTRCGTLGLIKAQESYNDTSTTQSAAQGLFGGFSFRCLKKTQRGESWIHSTAQTKEHSKTEFEKKNSANEFGESETFYRSKFSRATGVRPTINSMKYLVTDSLRIRVRFTGRNTLTLFKDFFWQLQREMLLQHSSSRAGKITSRDRSRPDATLVTELIGRRAAPAAA